MPVLQSTWVDSATASGGFKKLKTSLTLAPSKTRMGGNGVNRDLALWLEGLVSTAFIFLSILPSLTLLLSPLSPPSLLYPSLAAQQKNPN